MRRDVWVLASALVLVALAIAYLARLTPNEEPTIEQVLPPAELADLAELRARWGDGGDFVAVLLRTRGAAVADDRLASLEGALGAAPHVVRTWSRLSRPRLTYDGRDLSVGVRPRLATEPEERLDHFLAPGADAVIVIASVSAHAATLTGARELSRAVDAIARAERGAGAELYAVGSPLLRVATWDAAARDAARMLPVLVGAVVVVPLLFFHSAWAALFPFALAALASGATLALNRVVTGATSPWMLVLLPLVWSVATMDAMHFYESARHHAGRPNAVEAARRELFVPCLLTASTTAASLAVLAAPGGPTLFRAVGAWGALGALLAWALTFVLGGPLLRLMGAPRPAPRWPTTLARRAVVFVARRPRRFVVVWVGITLALGSQVPRLTVESRYPRVFADGAGGPFEADLRALPDAVDADLLPLEIHLEATTERARRPDALVLATVGFHQYLGTLPETRLSLSAATLIDEWSRSDPRALELLARAKRDPAAMTTASAVLADPRIRAWIMPERGAARMQVLLSRTTYARKDELLRFIRHYGATTFEDYRVRFSGPLYVYWLAEREGIAGVAQGSALDVGLILLTFAVVFRRLRATLSALLVNVVPVVVLLGLMAIAHVPWSIGLLGLPVIVLGLAVDDTVHLLWDARARRVPPRRAFVGAIRRSAAAILSTGALLAGCLSALARSGFAVNSELGVLLPLGLGLALLAELTFLPALLSLRAPRRR